MKFLSQVSIFDIQEFNIKQHDKEILLDTFECLIIKTSALVKKAKFNIDDFAGIRKKIHGYTLIMERIRREPKLEQWKAIIFKNGKKAMVVLGQWDAYQA